MKDILLSKEEKAKDLPSLKLVSELDKFPSWVVKKDGQVTLVSQTQTYYLYFAKKDYDFQQIYNFWVEFAQNNPQKMKIEVQSFVTKQLSLEQAVQAIAEGVWFASHSVVSYQTTPIKIVYPTYWLVVNELVKSPVEKILQRSRLKLQAVNWARDLQDQPPNKLRATDFVQEVIQKFRGIKKIKVRILTKKEIVEKKMGLLLAVNAGSSHHEPRVVILSYRGKPQSSEVLGIIGKGITFDSGGYNLKSTPALAGMKFDMSGAATVCAAFWALVKENPVLNLTVIACLTENSIGGQATFPESVIESMNGKTVEINNTDAEGRLALADGITYAIRQEKVSKIITVATLTGAVVNALGEHLTGVLTNHRPFYRQLRQAFARSQERYWELPIILENSQSLKENTSVADLGNIMKDRSMGASGGAAFLQEFSEKRPFIHCDIAGTAWKSKNRRGTGAMVRTLIELILG